MPITIAFLVVIIVGTLFLETTDTPPTLYAHQETKLQVTKGKTLLIRNNSQLLKASESIALQMGDTVKTLPKSQATIFWADGSVTRLAEKTSIHISSLNVSSDLSSVQIRFDTDSGKTWSNVIRSLLPDSFFEQTYDHGNYVATVRGTIFEVNLDKNYVQAVHHSIAIQNLSNNSKVEVPQGTAINALNWKAIGKEILDTAWEKLNTNEDVRYVDQQMKKLSDTLKNYTKPSSNVENWIYKIRQVINKKESVDSILSENILNNNTDKITELRKSVTDAKTPEQKALLHARLLAYYQATNLLPENNSTLLLRDTLRDFIIETAPEDKQAGLQKTFLQGTFNDYVDALKSGVMAPAVEHLKTKLKTSLANGIDVPFLKEFSQKAQSIIEDSHVKGALEEVKNTGTQLIEQTKKASINTNATQAIDGIKNDATNIFNSLKDAASK